MNSKFQWNINTKEITIIIRITLVIAIIRLPWQFCHYQASSRFALKIKEALHICLLWDKPTLNAQVKHVNFKTFCLICWITIVIVLIIAIVSLKKKIDMPIISESIYLNWALPHLNITNWLQLKTASYCSLWAIMWAGDQSSEHFVKLNLQV